jgi:hypothetical protein
MTQLLLFETQSAPTHSDVTEFVRVSNTTRTQPVTTQTTPGVQRMGDLARLVLLRYELVARRRTAKRS